MKTKREILKSVENHYPDYMSVWTISTFGSSSFAYQLIPFFSTKEEEFHLIANAANKFWELIDV